MTGTIWKSRNRTSFWETLTVAILTAAALMLILGTISWIITPEYECTSYKEVDVIEDVMVGGSSQKIVVTKTFCANWAEKREDKQ
jgi:hypothetical protein